MKLTAKHQAFISHYLTCWIGAEAARRTDPTYKRPDQVAYEYLRIPEIQEEIQRRLTELKMGSDETLTRLSHQARADLSDFIDVSDPDTEVEAAENMDEAHAAHIGWRLNLAKAKKAGKLHLIRKLKAGQWGPEIELYDQQSALALLGKHHKLFVDKVEHSGADGKPLFPDFEKALEKTYAADNPTTEPTERA
jgi:phage terminase small subunit